MSSAPPRQRPSGRSRASWCGARAPSWHSSRADEGLETAAVTSVSAPWLQHRVSRPEQHTAVGWPYAQMAPNNASTTYFSQASWYMPPRPFGSAFCPSLTAPPALLSAIDKAIAMAFQADPLCDTSELASDCVKVEAVSVATPPCANGDDDEEDEACSMRSDSGKGDLRDEACAEGHARSFVAPSAFMSAFPATHDPYGHAWYSRAWFPVDGARDMHPDLMSLMNMHAAAVQRVPDPTATAHKARVSPKADTVRTAAPTQGCDAAQASDLPAENHVGTTETTSVTGRKRKLSQLSSDRTCAPVEPPSAHHKVHTPSSAAVTTITRAKACAVKVEQEG